MYVCSRSPPYNHHTQKFTTTCQINTPINVAGIGLTKLPSMLKMIRQTYTGNIKE